MCNHHVFDLRDAEQIFCRLLPWIYWAKTADELRNYPVKHKENHDINPDLNLDYAAGLVGSAEVPEKILPPESRAPP